MRNYLVYPFMFLLLVATELLAQADLETISVAVPTNRDVQMAVGLIFNGQETRQVPSSEVVRVTPDTVLVRFPFNPQELQNHTMASAIAANNDGSFSYGTVQELGPNSFGSSLYELPVCQAQNSLQSLQPEMSTMEQLIKIRDKIRNNRQQQLRVLVDKKTIENILKLENGFGLTEGQDFDLSAHPLELIERLSRLHDAVRNYRLNRDRQKAAERDL